MAYDGIMMQAVVGDLRRRLVEARVQKIYQPRAQRLTLELYAGGAPCTLLVVAEPARARVQLTAARYANPQQPPTFCMVLRKHLAGGRILAVEQDRLERVLTLSVRRRHEAGTAVRRLVVEIMGRHSNVLLLDEAGTIIDAIKRVPASRSRHRQVLPGEAYVAPPDQGKRDPRAWTPETWQEAAVSAVRREAPLWRLFFEHVMGVGPQTARELAARSERDPEAPVTASEAPAAWQGLRWLRSVVADQAFAPGALRDADGRVVTFAPFPLHHRPPGPGERWQTFVDVHALLDAVYGSREGEEALKARADRLQAAVEDRLGRLAARIDGQRQALERAGDAGRLHRLGELLKTCLHEVTPGGEAVEVTDWFQANQPRVTIPLDPRLSPAENVERYFERYRKLTRTGRQARAQLARLRPRRDYLQEVLYHLEAARQDGEAAPELLVRLEEELAAQGIVAAERKKPAPRRADPDQAPPFRRGLSSQGIPILIGRSSGENDRLTFETAHPDDFWLHAKDRPGSHVVLRLAASDPHRDAAWDELLTSLHEAAQLAAYFSSARRGSNVPVDVTRCRQVRRRPGGGPGLVTYRNHQTLYPTPDAATVSAILGRAGTSGS